MLTKILRNAHFRVEAAKSCRETFDDKKNKLQLELPSVIESWLVLDGALSPLWVDSMSTLLDAQRRLQLANGEQVDLQRECFTPPRPAQPRPARSPDHRTLLFAQCIDVFAACFTVIHAESMMLQCSFAS